MCRLLIFFLVMGGSIAAAQTTSAPPVYRMSREDFLKQAGSDDSLRAVVNLYYRKRKTASTLVTAGVASLGVFIIGNIVNVLQASGSGDPGDDLTLFSGITGTAFIGASIAGSVRLIRYPRQRLQTAIADRQMGKPLPARLCKKLKPEDFEN